MTSRARRDALGLFFDADEVRQLERARRAVDARRATVVYAVFENAYARGGGIWVVARHYPPALAASGRDVVVLSPCHTALSTAPARDALPVVARCAVPFYAGEPITVELLEETRDGVRWILLRAPGFFEAAGGPDGTNPYDHSEPGGGGDALLVDSLFASAAIPHALAALGLHEQLVVHVQDWELAATALSVKLALLSGALASAAVVLTAHNPYDHALPPYLLDFAFRRRARRPLFTVYQNMIELTDAPLSTVSATFARELVSDPLQTHHFADHLQGAFARHGVVGVDNGAFGEPREPFAEAAVAAARAGRGEAILRSKRARRRAMLTALEADPAGAEGPVVGRLLGQERGGEVGGPLATLPDDVPVFFMFGRPDPGQKGFDVLAGAIARLGRGRARFVLTPSGTGPEPFFEPLRRLAAERDGEVVVYPFRMERGFAETMAGASFVVMPSLYEPFGGATEPYLAGTPVLARATGGIVQQIVDADDDRERCTGLLYRERVEVLDDAAALGAQWARIEGAEGPAAREEVPLYRAMVAALTRALRRACAIHRDEPALYARMLANVGEQAASFSWDETTRAYAALYAQATR